MVNSLFDYYQKIGRCLLKNEADIWFYPYGNLDYIKGIQEELSFIPLEVLESYRDDLIDSSVKESSLNIPVKFKFYFLRIIFIIGIFFSIGFGIYLAIAGAKFVSASAMAIFMTTPFLTMFFLCPTDKSARRMKFAHVLSNEIYRRRGGDTQISIKSILWQKISKGVLGEVSTRIIH